jgi:NAD(P)-dependent dehydrogenase (short-subunit alcohol dehydrogenase family)
MRNSQGDRWTEADVPAQRGRTAVITGANTGLGFETARVLAARGAQVVLACRDLGQAKEAATRITGGRPQSAGTPTVDVQAVRLDLASLASIHEAADEIGSAYGSIDLLVNNAGVMMTPFRRATLRAAADPGARGGEYYGPGGRGELRGYPRPVDSSDRARDAGAQQRLWRESERLTGVSYPV